MRRSVLLTSIGMLGVLIVVSCSSQEYTTAKLAIQQQEWDKAEEFLNLAMEVEPDNPEIPYQQGYEIYARKGEWDQMNAMFEKAVAIDPNKKLFGGTQTVAQLVDDARGFYWANLYNEGVGYYNAYRSFSGEERAAPLEKAIETFETALRIKPDEGQTYIILATCYHDGGQQEKAVDYAVKAAELDKDDFNANFAAGQILSQARGSEAALPYFKLAVELDPSNSQAIRNLAQTYYDLDQKDKSITTFEEAITKETDRKVKADLYFNLGVLHMQVENFEMAEDNFLTAYDLNPDDVEALVGMAQTFESAEKWRRAEKFYRELIQLDPDNPEHYRGIARVLIRQGKPDEAQHYFEKSKRIGQP